MGARECYIWCIFSWIFAKFFFEFIFEGGTNGNDWDVDGLKEVAFFVGSTLKFEIFGDWDMSGGHGLIFA